MDYYEPRDDLDDPPFQSPSELSPMQKVYEGACIFITGATGFMGKVLMEKLLRTCNVSRIYILVRDKKGVKSQERVAALFDDVFFELLKLQKPGEVAKVSIISGDCSLPDLGLSEADKAKMVDVNIIFHAAATLYLDQHLKVAYITNILSTKTLLEFAKSMPRLKAFMYVSTAYTHAYRDVVDEIFYDIVLDEDDIGDLCNQLDEAQIGALTGMLTGRWGNTYALTKACAENLISKYDGILPIGVVRPSIVVATWTEPLKGWINNFYGAVGVVAGTGLGAIRVWCTDPTMDGDLIPVDAAINMTLAATFEVITKNTNVKIYNCVASPTNPISWNILRSANFSHGNSLSTAKAIAAPDLILVRNKTLFYIYSCWHHVIPAIFFDMILKITGKPPQLLKIYIKMYYVNILLSPYCAENKITFTSDNIYRLWDSLDPVDKHLFNFDMSSLDWKTYWWLALKGMRVYLINDPMDTVEEGERLRIKLKIRKFVFESIIRMSIAYVIYFFSKDTLASFFVN